MQPRTDDFVLMVSIAPFEIALSLHSGRYVIPAAPERRGEKDPETGLPYTTLKVWDGRVPNANYNRSKPNLIEEPVDCRQIAEDILTMKVRRTPLVISGRAMWGVGILPEINSEKVTAEFFKNLERMQLNMCRRLIEAAEVHAERKELHLITEPMKMAAYWVKLDAPWLRRDYMSLDVFESAVAGKQLFDDAKPAKGRVAQAAV